MGGLTFPVYECGSIAESGAAIHLMQNYHFQVVWVLLAQAI